MIVQCLSIGTAFWQRSAQDRATGLPVVHRSAYFNTSAFQQGKRVFWNHRKAGFVRINGTAIALLSRNDLLQRRFQTPGPEEYQNSTRLLLVSRAEAICEEDAYLVCLKSSDSGLIDFASAWRSPRVRLIASSFRHGAQETLLLLPRGGFIITDLGKWEVACSKQVKYMALA